MCTILITATGVFHASGLRVQANVKTVVDPSLRIDMAFPWNDGSQLLNSIIRDEVSAFRIKDESPSEEDASDLGLDEFLPRNRPFDVGIDWQPVNVELQGGESASMMATISPGTQPFAFCFFAVDTNQNEIVSTSDVVIAWTNGASVPMLAFANG